MGHKFSKVMFTEAVKRLQERAGSRKQYERRAQSGPSDDELGPDEREFIARRDSFYIASEGENGWPYIQHRGGEKGFLKVLDGKTIAFADYAGNKQYITAGNVSDNDKVTLFLMDYPNRTRLKILGHAEIVEAGREAALAKELEEPKSGSKVERLFRIRVVAFDWNCPQHITPRFTEEELLGQLELMGDEERG